MMLEARLEGTVEERGADWRGGDWIRVLTVLGFLILLFLHKVVHFGNFHQISALFCMEATLPQSLPQKSQCQSLLPQSMQMSIF